MSDDKKEPVLESAESIAYRALMGSASKTATDTPEQMRKEMLDLWNNAISKTTMTCDTYTVSQLAAIAAGGTRHIQNQLMTEEQRATLNSIMSSVTARMNELMRRQQASSSETYVRAIYSCARDRSFSQRTSSIK